MIRNSNNLSIFVLFFALILLPFTALAEEVTVMLPGDVPMTLVKVPAGTFLMGSPEGERGNFLNNETQHQVTLTQDYFLGKTEVTQQQWAAVMGEPMRTVCGDITVGDDFPVYCVTWNRITGPGGFIEKLNTHLESTAYRLPTEAEWERAARAGTTTRYAHGDVLECSDECGACPAHDANMWWCGNVDPFGPKPVGQKNANPFGLHDMHGNLWEIVNDRYGEFSTEPVTDPSGPGGSGDVVIRGGGKEAWINRSASRVSASPDDRAQNNEVGFRVAATGLEANGFEINSGLNDAWYNPATDGQGFLISVFPDRSEMFVAWFTYGDDTASGQRWFTAQGTFEGPTAVLDVYETTGGSFDDPEVPETVAVGTMSIDFEDCSNAELSYSITAEELAGDVLIQRAVPGAEALCEDLSGTE